MNSCSDTGLHTGLKATILPKPQSLIIFTILFLYSVVLNSQPAITKEGRTLLKVTTGITYVFKNFAPEIWDGYNLYRQPYLAYLPGEFALYLNAKIAPEGFEAYPVNWPDLGTTAFIHYGKYDDLSGQFAFDYNIDSTITFAMGLPKNLLFSFPNPTFFLLSTTIHEGFHQYQHQHFGEIPWAREEKYPILDVQNTALASLEMHILKDALLAMFAGQQKQMEELLKQFAGVRDYRWNHSAAFIRKYEQGQEINEGTARFVEMKAVQCLLSLKSKKTDKPLLLELAQEIDTLSFKKILLNDMESRLTGLAVAPENMLRNRIYPIGAYLGFLLDGLHIEWKKAFQSAGSTISFHGLLIKHFAMDQRALDKYMQQAKSSYPYQKIYAQAKTLIDKYLSGYEKTFNEFDNQPGIKVAIDIPASGLRRFRSSKEKKWIVEQGKITLCRKYNLYSLEKKALKLEVHNKGLLDQSDWDNNRKRVLFFVPNMTEIKLDGRSVDLRKPMSVNFISIEISGSDFKFKAESKGVLKYKGDCIDILIH